MKFLADMGISLLSVEWLRERKHDVVHVRELGMKTSPDCLILERAKSENRIVLTCDLDFGTLMAASKGVSPSVIIFRLDNATSDYVNIRLNEVLSTASEHLVNGSIISVEQTRYRVRKLPVQ